MNINLKNAAKKFFPNVPFKDVYLEAVANALDAHATKISIDIYMDAPKDYNSIRLEIADNGDGFNDDNYSKFCRLMENEDEEHKGLGRLVYLRNFKNVLIQSSFSGKSRKFNFDYDFDASYLEPGISDMPNGTCLTFTGYNKTRIASSALTNPAELKDLILENLLPQLYLIRDKGLEIKIALHILGSEKSLQDPPVVISRDDLPELKRETFDVSDFGGKIQFELLYYVAQNNSMGRRERNLLTALSVDNRLIKRNIFNRGKIPPNYEAIFILKSNTFTGKTDDTRENLTMDREFEELIRKEFTARAAEILKREIPTLVKSNEDAEKIFAKKYPHLVGLYDSSYVGIMDEKTAFEDAEATFSKIKKEILNAEEINNEIYEKALNISSRTLGEYILYRARVIQGLKGCGEKDSEGKIHDIIVPRKHHFEKKSTMEDLRANNAWLLDDKYMSYSHIFSDLEMSKISDVLNANIVLYKPERRPDIAIVSTEDPETVEKFEVVVVELKRLDLDVKRNRDVVEQLKQRARNLLQLYPEKISRIWFYGVVDFDDEFSRSLFEDGWIEIYSKDQVLYKRQPILKNDGTKGEAEMFLMSYKSVWLDAEHRNETFLKILRDGLRRESQKQ